VVVPALHEGRSGPQSLVAPLSAPADALKAVLMMPMVQMSRNLL
jgi:hypothetical protein